MSFPHLDAPYDAPMLKCCSVVFPDYKQRVVAHEAAHFLAGYLLRVPVANYSLMLGKVCRRSGHKPLGCGSSMPRWLLNPYPPPPWSMPSPLLPSVSSPVSPLLQEHTDLVEAKLQKRLIEGSLEPAQVDQLSVIAMAGATAEAMKFEEVIGQNADFFDLQVRGWGMVDQPLGCRAGMVGQANGGGGGGGGALG